MPKELTDSSSLTGSRWGVTRSLGTLLCGCCDSSTSGGECGSVNPPAVLDNRRLNKLRILPYVDSIMSNINLQVTVATTFSCVGHFKAPNMLLSILMSYTITGKAFSPMARAANLHLRLSTLAQQSFFLHLPFTTVSPCKMRKLLRSAAHRYVRSRSYIWVEVTAAHTCILLWNSSTITNSKQHNMSDGTNEWP
jgi:hypothetical protein